MKKLIPLTLIIIGVLVLAGIKIISSRKTSTSPSTSQSGSVKKSILAWIKSGTGVKCQLDKNGQQVTVLAKGDKVKVVGESIPLGNRTKRGNLINDGQWIYIWTDQDQQGIKYPLPQGGEENKPNESTKVFSLEEWSAQWEQHHYSCQPAKISDQEFVPPQGIEFVNFGDLINQFQESSKKISENTKKIEK